MRFLFTFAGGGGHFDPLRPIARAAEDAGHAVGCGCQPGMMPVVEAAGFTAFDTGGDTLGRPERRPLLELDPEREDEALREGFARRTARDRAGRILSLCAEWKPDLIVCDEVDFGAMVAAERSGLPHATVSVIAAGSFIRPELVAEPLNELRTELGLPPDPGVRMLSRYLVLAPLPPSYRDPAFPLPATAHRIRPVMPDPAAAAVPPPWKAVRPGAPTVYFTLGTIFNLESGDLFDRVVAGLAQLPVNLVVTVGRDIDPTQFGPQPEHVHIERYLPQPLVLPHCQLVVSHGGSGSVIGALAHGVPWTRSASHPTPPATPRPPCWPTPPTAAPPNGCATKPLRCPVRRTPWTCSNDSPPNEGRSRWPLIHGRELATWAGEDRPAPHTSTLHHRTRSLMPRRAWRSTVVATRR